MAKLNSLKDLGSVFKNNKIRETREIDGYEEHHVYPEGAYVSDIKRVLSDDISDDLDFWKIDGKSGEHVSKKGIEDIDKDISTSASFLYTLQKSRSEILSALSIYESKQSHNKVIIIAKKIDALLVQGLKDLDKKDAQDFIKGVDLSKINFSKENPEEKIYMGVVTDVKKESVVVCMGNILGEPIEYNIPYEKISDFVKKRGFELGNRVFVDLKKDNENTTLVDYSEFRQQRFLELKKNGLEFNGNNFNYMTRSGKILKGKIIGLGEDINAKQVVFQTEDGKKFPISIEGLKKGIKLAKEKSSSDQNKKFEKDTNQRKSFKKNVRDRELPERVA